MPALSNGTADVLPFGSIPSCTYIGQGDDLVIFGGTVADGSECCLLSTSRKPLLEESLIDCAFEMGGLSEKVLTLYLIHI